MKIIKIDSCEDCNKKMFDMFNNIYRCKLYDKIIKDKTIIQSWCKLEDDKTDDIIDELQAIKTCDNEVELNKLITKLRNK